MSNKIKKNDRLYQDALIWMGYRYAIGPLKAMKARPYICSFISEEYIVEDEI